MKVTLRKIGGSAMLLGANTEVLLDGWKIPNLASLRLELKANNIGRLTLELLPDELEIDADLLLELKEGGVVSLESETIPPQQLPSGSSDSRQAQVQRQNPSE